MSFIQLIVLMTLTSFYPENGATSRRLEGTWESNDTGVLTTFIFYEDHTFDYLFILDEDERPEIIRGRYECERNVLTFYFEHGAIGIYSIEELTKDSLTLRHKETLIEFKKL